MPEEEACRHERVFHYGFTLVTVRAGDRYEEAVAILRAEEQWEEPRHGHAGSGLGRLADESGAAPGTGSAFVPPP